MASSLYNPYKVLALKGTITPLSQTIKLALLTSSYTPALTDAFFGSINSNEASGTGYTAGGVTLGSITITEDDVNNRGVFGAANPTWTGLTVTNVRYAVIYQSTGTPSTSPLIAWIDLGTNQTFSGDTFTINFAAAGVFYIQ